MSIFSIVFLIFLFITAVIYFLCPKNYQWIVLLVASYVFYCYGGGYKTVVFMIVTTIITFFGGLYLDKIQRGFEVEKAKDNVDVKLLKQKMQSRKKLVLALLLIANFGILARLKYGEFLYGIIVDALNIQGRGITGILLPLGISFYTFQSSGYLIDIYRKRIKPDTNLAKFALFVSFFPQIIQGPISRYDQLASELYAPHEFAFDRIVRGAQRVLWGYIKKLVIADRISVIVATIFDGYGDANYVGLTVFFGVFMYGIQIYADFSGGIDIIIGISEALGIKVTENFRQPFMAKSVAEFWQRWHITLGAWMRNYIFYPMALSKPFSRMSKFFRKHMDAETGKMIPSCIASFIVFVIVGIWHGAAWKFVVYGIFQAVFVSSATLLEGVYNKVNEKLYLSEDCFTWSAFRTIRTVIILTFGRYFARADSLTAAIEMLKATFSSFNPWIFVDGTLLDMGLTTKNFYFMWIMILVMWIVDIIHERGHSIRDFIKEKHIVIRWTLYFGALFMIIIFGIYGPGYNANIFIYQGF